MTRFAAQVAAQHEGDCETRGWERLLEDYWIRLPWGKKVHRIALGLDTYCGLNVRENVLKLALVGNPLEKDKCSFCHWSADPND